MCVPQLQNAVPKIVPGCIGPESSGTDHRVCPKRWEITNMQKDKWSQAGNSPWNACGASFPAGHLLHSQTKWTVNQQAMPKRKQACDYS